MFPIVPFISPKEIARTLPLNTGQNGKSSRHETILENVTALQIIQLHTFSLGPNVGF